MSNIKPIFANPITAKMITYGELKETDGQGNPKLDLYDFCVMNEIIMRNAKDQENARKHEKMKADMEKALSK